MDDIKIGSLSLSRFDKDNKYHMIFFKKLIHDEDILNRFQGFLHNLNNKSSEDIFGKGFFVKDEDELIGYVDFGAYHEDDKSVYIREAIASDKRGKSYGKRTLTEVTDYIFRTYPFVESIKARIASDNYICISMAWDCGFTNKGEYFTLDNPYIKNNNHSK